MERGLYISASGMIANQLRLDVIANRLANATNSGYKGEKVAEASFGDLLLQNTKTGGAIGPLSTGAHLTEVVTDATQGALRVTNNPLDLAIQGDGWLSVRAPDGIRYTRNGQLTTNPQGLLVTENGDPVLSTTGQPIKVGGEAISVNQNGIITDATGRRIGQLQLTLLDPASLVHEGRDYMTGTALAATADRPLGTISQGAVEQANVNAVEDMVALIQTMREFEANQKAAKAIDDTLGLAATQVGKV